MDFALEKTWIARKNAKRAGGMNKMMSMQRAPNEPSRLYQIYLVSPKSLVNQFLESINEIVSLLHFLPDFTMNGSAYDYIVYHPFPINQPWKHTDGMGFMRLSKPTISL